MRMWITGYRSYELGIFSNQDPKVKVIKYLLKRYIIQKFNDGLEWIITGGQLGVEQWSVETALKLKKDYPELKVSMIYPFANFGEQWNDQNRARLHDLEMKVDFYASVSNQPYQSPEQLRNFQKFMLKHTDEVTFIYDNEYPGKSRYDYQKAQDYAHVHEYRMTVFTMDDLQEAANEFQEYLGNQNDF